jgi:2-aminoethylphosphonate-pyruvate transaminase
MTDNEQREILLTPGPLTTSRATREAMLRDWGSRDGDFIVLTARIRSRIIAIAGGEGTHDCVPIQGSGTYVLEAAVGSFVPPDGKLLVVVNGAYGHRIARICGIIGRQMAIYETDENVTPDPAKIGKLLAEDLSISHVAVVHCETTSGIINPVANIARVVARAGRKLMIDAMSSFGAIPLDLAQIPCDVVMASSNKCLEGVPGLGFVVASLDALDHSAGNAHSLSLDLHDQWAALQKSGEWRFTPPTHVCAALDQALAEHTAEGGVLGRGARYGENCQILVDGMRALGFETYLPDGDQAPIIVTFLTPADPNFEFQKFYDALHGRGCVIYPGKLTRIDSFRIGCIGDLHAADMRRALQAIGDVLGEMGVDDCTPAVTG